MESKLFVRMGMFEWACLRTIYEGGAAIRQLTKVAEKSGAGEGIRTLDPNLGKVVLYP